MPEDPRLSRCQVPVLAALLGLVEEGVEVAAQRDRDHEHGHAARPAGGATHSVHLVSHHSDHLFVHHRDTNRGEVLDFRRTCSCRSARCTAHGYTCCWRQGLEHREALAPDSLVQTVTQ